MLKRNTSVLIEIECHILHCKYIKLDTGVLGQTECPMGKDRHQNKNQM